MYSVLRIFIIDVQGSKVFQDDPQIRMLVANNGMYHVGIIEWLYRYYIGILQGLYIQGLYRYYLGTT